MKVEGKVMNKLSNGVWAGSILLVHVVGNSAANVG